MISRVGVALGLTVTATYGHDKVTVDAVEDLANKATIATLTFAPG